MSDPLTISKPCRACGVDLQRFGGIGRTCFACLKDDQAEAEIRELRPRRHTEGERR